MGKKSHRKKQLDNTLNKLPHLGHRNLFTQKPVKDVNSPGQCGSVDWASS